MAETAIKTSVHYPLETTLASSHYTNHVLLTSNCHRHIPRYPVSRVRCSRS